MASKRNPKVFEGLNIFLMLLSTIKPFKACDILKNVVNTDLTFEILHTCKNNLLNRYEYSSILLEDMIKSYKLAIST